MTARISSKGGKSPTAEKTGGKRNTESNSGYEKSLRTFRGGSRHRTFTINRPKEISIGRGNEKTTMSFCYGKEVKGEE